MRGCDNGRHRRRGGRGRCSQESERGNPTQDFQYFYRAVTHMEKTAAACLALLALGTREKRDFASQSLTIQCFRDLKQSRFSSEVVAILYCRGSWMVWFDIEAKHGGAGPNPSCLMSLLIQE